MMKTRQKLDKYRIEKLLGQGGFASVYRAYDTIEGIRVALKVPHAQSMSGEFLADVRNEVRLTARMDHPNILPIKTASVIGKRLVIAYALGEQTLADRLTRRMSDRTAISLAEQIIDALAYAHHKRIIHCDVKPENFILFPGNWLRLVDFGISKFAVKTVQASGSGTVGYMAPEQAMGKPSFRSDVFSAGVVLYRMFSGRLPEWPFEWPLPGADRLKKKYHPDFLKFLRRALDLKPAKRFRDAEQMCDAFQRLKPRILREQARRNRRRNGRNERPDWKIFRQQQFKRQYGKLLEVRHTCKNCDGPVSESMQHCPWCGKSRRTHDDTTSFPLHCPSCRRGMKLDWSYCPWCYSGPVVPDESRSYSDRRYVTRCSNSKCKDKRLMPFMRYCPWCHRKVKRKWKINEGKAKCSRCDWGTLPEYWDYCPWCGKAHGRL